MVDRIQELHNKVHEHLPSTNMWTDVHKPAKSFKISDLAMIHLRKSRLPIRSHNKLTNKKYGPFNVLGKISANAYQIDLPSSLHINST